jgi:signal transduction histidine kinase/ActR/RegA family two-component response regulator
MISRARRWLGRVPTADPFERRTAITVQAFCIGLAALLCVNTALDLTISARPTYATSVLGSATDLLSLAACLSAIFCIRRGRIRLAYALLVSGFVSTLFMSLAVRGLEYHSGFLLRVFAILLVLPALLLGRRALWWTMLTLLAGMGIGHLRDLGLLGPHVAQAAAPPPLGLWGQAIAVMILLAIVLDRFGAALAEAYTQALRRQQDAESARLALTGAMASLEAEMAQRAQAEALLVHAQRLEAVGRLSGGVAHDFNNLLTAIIGFAELSRNDRVSSDTRREYLDHLIQAADRGTKLTRQLLTLARRQIVEPRVIRIEERLASVEPLLRRLVGEQVRIERLSHGVAHSVRIDPEQLDQVLMNLAVNAGDAMPVGGTLRFETDLVQVPAGPEALADGLVAGPHVRLRVTDDGQGMDAETLDHLFEPFFTTKAVGAGTGLGLATCSGIIARANGAIQVQSALGKGTTFEILLPACEEAPTGDEPLVAPATTAGDEVVLVVEDDLQVLGLVERVIRAQGYTPLSATTAAKAEELVRGTTDRIDLVLTDVVLPGTNGRRLAETLTSMRPGMRVIYMSGHSDDVIARHGALEPGIHLLPKPFTPHELTAKLRAVLDAQESRSR